MWSSGSYRSARRSSFIRGVGDEHGVQRRERVVGEARVARPALRVAVGLAHRGEERLHRRGFGAADALEHRRDRFGEVARRADALHHETHAVVGERVVVHDHVVGHADQRQHQCRDHAGAVLARGAVEHRREVVARSRGARSPRPGSRCARRGCRRSDARGRPRRVRWAARSRLRHRRDSAVRGPTACRCPRAGRARCGRARPRSAGR